MYYRETSVNTGQDISNLFASYFQSTFLEPETTTVDDEGTSNERCSNAAMSISTVDVNHSRVLKLLKSLDLTKSGGPDLIPPLFIVTCTDSLAEPITILFRRSLSEGKVPMIWKSAFVTPVFKKGDKANVENYRPISKICLFSKVLERIVYTDVYAAFKTILGDEQHGFVRNRSTTSNLLLSQEFITHGMAQRQVDVIYTDYSKCFDRIDHRMLLKKLFLAGIHGDLYRWFSSYIENRTQAVVLQGYTSGWSSVPSGVPQGSILGPLLFILFITDIKQCFHHSYILLYADDMKIHKVVRDMSDAYQLQDDLHRFEMYCKRNKLQLNVSKCFVLTFSRRTSLINFNYSINHELISRLNGIRDLGVIVDNKLLFDQHVNSIVTKASKALGFILRTTACFRSLKPVKILYCSFVRSHLEYASQVWNPQYEIYKSRIEGVQRKFLRYLDYRARQYSVDYEHRCKRYHFLPLDMRRNIGDITMLMSVANGHIDCPELVANLALRTNLMGLRQRPILSVPFTSTNYGKNVFSIRSALDFNRLSKDLDIDLFCTSVASLRQQIAQSFFNS